MPLFSQSTGNIQRPKMIADSEFEDFTAFEGGANTAYSSPGFPAVPFDLNSNASSSTNNMATISPQDLLISDPSFMSAPNSTALTALTSPSIYNDSPDFGDSYDVSPAFEGADFDPGSADTWFPLFPPTQQAALPKVEHSPATQSDELEVPEPTSATSGHQRRKSGYSPPSGRHSSVSGVNPRSRSKPLPPIIIDDPNDIVAMKRARNTLAARKSRERKAVRLEELEEQIEKLKADVDYWKNQAIAHGAPPKE